MIGASSELLLPSTNAVWATFGWILVVLFDLIVSSFRDLSGVQPKDG